MGIRYTSRGCFIAKGRLLEQEQELNSTMAAKRFFTSLLCVFWYSMLALLAKGSPVGGKITSKDLDLENIYSPDPPVTHRVLMTIEYYDQVEAKTENEEITIELFGTNTPKTVQNFAALCVGMRFAYENGDPEEIHFATFKESLLHKIIKNKLIQGGDVFERHMPLSIYGHNWPDENFLLKHDRPGRLSMYNKGPNTQGSEFFITTDVAPASEFDMKNVVFGQVVSGLEWLIDKVQYVPTDESGKPLNDVMIKYVTIDELTLGNKDLLQSNYIEKLNRFNRGEIAEGVNFKSILKKGNTEKQEMDDIKLQQLANPLRNVMFGIISLCGIYLLAKYRRFILPKSSKIVSMRHE